MCMYDDCPIQKLEGDDKKRLRWQNVVDYQRGLLQQRFEANLLPCASIFDGDGDMQPLRRVRQRQVASARERGTGRQAPWRSVRRRLISWVLSRRSSRLQDSAGTPLSIRLPRHVLLHGQRQKEPCVQGPRGRGCRHEMRGGRLQRAVLDEWNRGACDTPCAAPRFQA